ncbi:MAG: alpha/beta fold hydrolase [Bacteroidota bacterium]
MHQSTGLTIQPTNHPATHQLSPPRWLQNGHVMTVYVAKRRPNPVYPVERERLETPDDDFLDLDWARVGSRHVVVITHGLEGNTDRHYVRGMMRVFNQRGIDAVALNFRTCSGVMNRQVRTYHAGATPDLELTLHHVLDRGGYDTLSLVGFSLGGNVVLRYLGERGAAVPSEINGAAVFSVPVDLETSSRHMATFPSRLYTWRFMVNLYKKMRKLHAIHPEDVAPVRERFWHTFEHFDNRYTAPLHGYQDAMDYWTRASSLPVLDNIKVPALLVNALDDPFLPSKCYPYSAAKQNPNLTLLTPEFGGHVGFTEHTFDGVTPGTLWSEHTAATFLG